MVAVKEKMKKEIDDIWDELEVIKKAGVAHIVVTRQLRKRVRELEAEVARLKKKL